MKLEKIDETDSTVSCDECGSAAEMRFQDDKDEITYYCLHCFLNKHDRDRIQWYRRMWLLKSMMEYEEKKNKPKSPKWGIRSLYEK
ncbi:MAG: hypothetical protein ACFFA5_04305 [Promethearchaeota archaeon]